MSNWGDLERRVAALRKDLAAVRQALSKVGRPPAGGDQSQLDHLRQLETLRANELHNLEKELASRPY